MSNLIAKRMHTMFIDMIRLSVLAVGLLLCPRMIFAQAPVAAGSLTGQVTFTATPAEDSEIASQEIIRQYSQTSGRYSGGVQGGEREIEVVVYLQNAATAAMPRPAASAPVVVMDQKNQRFVPHVLPIHTGTEVRFLNSDSIYHNVFSLSATKSFDLGRYPTGSYRAVTFNKPGIVRIYCDIHTHMNAWVIVLDTPHFAVTGADGRFRIENVPPGSYDLVAWYGRRSKRIADVVIEPGKIKTVDVTFP